jgi:hypothetical protein
MPNASANRSWLSPDRRAFLASATIGLIGLFVGVVAINVFYATQLHLRVAEMQVNGVPINIWRTTDIGDLINQWDVRLECQRRVQVQARNALDNASREARAALDAMSDAERNFIDNLNKIRLELAKEPPKEPSEVVPPGASPPVRDADEGYLTIYRDLHAKGEKLPAWLKRRDELDRSYEALLGVRGAEQAARANATASKLALENADATRKGTEAEAARLFGLSTTDVQGELLERVRNLINELQRSEILPRGQIENERDRAQLDCRESLRPVTRWEDRRAARESKSPALRATVANEEEWIARAYDWLRNRAFSWKFALWPTDNLVLSLVVIMGVLGSCLHVFAERFGLAGETRESVDEADRSRTDLGQSLLRLFFGGVTALVVYLVAKASVPIVADTSRIGGQAPLNPYFISFVGIMSGLVSERAIKSLQRVGESVFSAGGKVDTTPRYATPMLTAKYVEKQKQMAAAKPDAVDSLAKYLGLPRGATEDAIAGKRAVMPNEQAVIAAFVGADEREAFSDLPPEGAKPRPAGAGGAQAGAPAYTPS